MSKYNHMFDVAFEVISEHEDWEDVPASEILAGMWGLYDSLKRELLQNGSIPEAFGCADSFKVDEEVKSDKS